LHGALALQTGPSSVVVVVVWSRDRLRARYGTEIKKINGPVIMNTRTDRILRRRRRRRCRTARAHMAAARVPARGSLVASAARTRSARISATAAGTCPRFRSWRLTAPIVSLRATVLVHIRVRARGKVLRTTVQQFRRSRRNQACSHRVYTPYTCRIL